MMAIRFPRYGSGLILDNGSKYNCVELSKTVRFVSEDVRKESTDLEPSWAFQGFLPLSPNRPEGLRSTGPMLS
ncbi:MAG: hypothetical protein ACUVR6_06150, partial [Anaerolineae bacterium]